MRRRETKHGGASRAGLAVALVAFASGVAGASADIVPGGRSAQRAGRAATEAPAPMQVAASARTRALAGLESPARAVSAAPPSASPTQPEGTDLSLLPSSAPVARLGDQTLRLSDFAPEIAFRVYRHQVDVYSLLKRAVEESVEERLLAREAARRNRTVAELLDAEVHATAGEATAEEVEAYLAAHPDAARQPGARERVAHYLTERRRIERRIAFVERLRAQAGFEFLLEPPTQPRVRLDLGSAPARGPADGPIELVHFATFSSPRSARSAEYVRRIVQAYPGRIRERFVALPNDRDELGLAAAQVAVEAEAHDRFWDLHDRLFATRGRFKHDDLARIAEDLGLKPIDPGSLRHLDVIRARIAAAADAGITQEPVLFVNGRYYSSTFPYEKLAALVEEELGGPRMTFETE